MTGKTTSASATNSERHSINRKNDEFWEHENGNLSEASEFQDGGEGTRHMAQRLQAIRKSRLADAIKKINYAAATQTSSIPASSSKPMLPRAANSPIPWRGSEPPFVVGSDGAFFGLKEVHPTAIVHTLAIGGTGSGKTASCVLPLLRSQLRYALNCHDEVKRSSILVIDPKRELLNAVRSVLKVKKCQAVAKLCRA